MTVHELRVACAVLCAAMAACGGQSLSRETDDASGGSNNGGSANTGVGGSTVGKGGVTGEGGSTSGNGGAGVGGSTAGAAATGMGGAGAGGTGGSATCSDRIVANQANNYWISSTLSFPIIEVQPNSELTFRWNEVTRDFLGHSIDPARGIDRMDLMLWALTPEEFRTKLRDDALEQRDLSLYATVDTQNTLTEASLFDVTSVGMPLTPEMILPYFDAEDFPPENYTYTLMLATGDVLGEGARVIQVFKLDPASMNTLVEVTDSSTRSSYSVDLQSIPPTAVPQRFSELTIDWSSLTVNARGHSVNPTDITEVVVAHYGESLAELEERFLDLELIAEHLWRGDVVSGTSMALSSLMDHEGQLFPGVAESGTWLVALRCGHCRHPAPWFMTRLTTCSLR